LLNHGFKSAVSANSTNSDGILGEALNEGKGVIGKARNGAGVWAESFQGEGVHGETSSDVLAAVAGIQLNENLREFPAGVYGESRGKGAGLVGIAKGSGAGIYAEGRIAGHFEGDVAVTGDVILTGGGADCAEEFDLSSTDDNPGTVMVINQSSDLEQYYQPYDKKVAEVISGAGSYKPAILLDKKTENKNKKRIPIALIGKVYCRVDAPIYPIEIGDLLTTSSTKGHAMKANDPYKAFGTVIGKALGSIKEGLGMIPVLVAPQ